VVERTAPLKERQVEILRWIADGCPAGAMQGYSYKTTAVALQDRRLVTVSKKGGTWRATLTAAGSYYLERGRHPDRVERQHGGRNRTAEPVRRFAEPTRSASDDGAEFASEPSPTPRTPKAKKQSPTESLVAEVIAAGGTLPIDRDRDQHRLTQVVSAANRFDKVPAGQRLVWEYRDGVRLLSLENLPSWMTADLAPIPVPATLRTTDPIIAALREADCPLAIKAAALRNRALRVLQGFIADAKERRHDVRLPKRRPDGIRDEEQRGQFFVAVGQHEVGVAITQEFDRAPHVATAAEEARFSRDPWARPPRHDFTPTQRLRIEVFGGTPHWGSVWSDGSSSTLENALPQVLQEIELRAAAAEQNRLDALERERQKRLKWEAAMQRARGAYAEAYRESSLERQVDKWHRAQRINEYLGVLRARIAELPQAEAEPAAAWLAWCDAYAEALDPLKKRLAMPAVPEPRPEDLRPFLRGLSPYGPW
jgi:hypothetical protein